MTIHTDEVDAFRLAEEYVKAPNPLLWDRAGEIRVVPPAVRENAIRVMDEGLSLVENGYLEAIPEHWCLIYWDQCVPVKRCET